MDKRYQVFVSSTYEDLRKERQEVIQALLELDCIPSGMELFSAGDDEVWAAIQRVIKECDYYVVIIGGRYGSTGDDGMSFTEREYRYALKQSIPVFGFVHGSPGSIQADQTERGDEGKGKLDAFRQLVQRKWCKPWTNAEGLAGAVSRAIAQAKQRFPAVGWIRADQAADPADLAENIELRKELEKVRKQLAEAGAGPLAGTEGLAQGDDEYTISVDDVAGRYSGMETKEAQELRFTWNDLLRHLGPRMRYPVYDEEFNDLLGDFAWHTATRTPGGTDRLTDAKSVVVQEDDRHAIRAHLKALGFLEEEYLSDGPGCGLTPRGHRTATLLLAVKKGGD